MCRLAGSGAVRTSRVSTWTTRYMSCGSMNNRAEPTDEGHARIAALRRTQHEVSAQVASPLGAEERRQLVDLLRRVLDNLEPDQCR